MTDVRIRSEYQPDHKPSHVAKWEKWANEAPTDTAALVQLIYFQALQIRMIKLVLIWTLIVLPIVLTVGFFLLTRALDRSSSSSF